MLTRFTVSVVIDPSVHTAPGARRKGTAMSQHKRNWFARHKVLTGLGAVVAVIAVGGAVGAGGGSDDKSPTSAAGQEAPKKAERTGGSRQPETKKEKGLGNGSFQVGSDIKPGTYVSSGNKDG